MHVDRIEVSLRESERDVRGERVREVAATLGIDAGAVRVTDLYWVSGIDVDGLACVRAAIVDPVVEVAALPAASSFVEVALHPGVTDPIAETLVRVAARLGYTIVAASGRRYSFASTTDVAAIAQQVLANPIVERWSIDAPLSVSLQTPSVEVAPVAIVPVRGASDAALEVVSKSRRLALDAAEMRAIAAHFEGLGRDPTDLELEMLAQTWSEHCVHKTFRALIDLDETERDGTRTLSRIDGLLKTYIRAATETLARPWVRSAFVDNAGIIALDDDFDIAIKVETHNHPSALEPFGGANTGMGGVIRDIIGVSARPFANLDVLCFAPPDLDAAALPAGALAPRRIADGVVHGIEDYGNKMGIPTVAGAVFYHPHYATNPLVFCGTVGVLPRGSHPTSPEVGDHVVVVGGRTGRDGLRGATFSSLGMDASSAAVSGGAVQIGHPIAEKQVLEVVMRARDERLYHAITDCGAGGLSSAVGEMGKDLGATIELGAIPTKYPGLAPWELWLSEAQERMVLAVPDAALARVLALAAEHESEATSIGRFGNDGRITITSGGQVVGDLDAHFLHDGIPRRRLRGTWIASPVEPAAGRMGSARDIVRRYDHEVQGGTIVRPLVGPGEGPSDAAVVVPLEVRAAWDGHSALPGVAIAVGMDPVLGQRDPYAMAWCAIDEAVRNVVAVGADPERIAILDNFSWGDPRQPDRLGALARCARGCHDAALAYGTPFVSGKDSLNNEWTAPDGTRHAIPPTLVITAVGIVPDVASTVTSAFVGVGDVLYVLGPSGDDAVPLPDAEAPHRYRALHRAIASGFVASCHDVSEGGIAAALDDMSRGGQLGHAVDYARLVADVGRDRLPSCEHPGRHIAAVAPAQVAAFEDLMQGLTYARIGVVMAP